MSLPNDVTIEAVLTLLRQLPPRDRLRVIAQALPETERDLSEPYPSRKSLLGLCADLGPAPSAEDIDQAFRTTSPIIDHGPAQVTRTRASRPRQSRSSSG